MNFDWFFLVCCLCRGPGIAVLIISWIITLYTLWQMVEMHEMVPGKRFDRYHELGQHAFGEKLGLWIVVPQQLVVEVGVNIVYMVTGGKSLKKFHDTVCSTCKPIKTTYFVMIFASVHSFSPSSPTSTPFLGLLGCCSHVSQVKSHQSHMLCEKYEIYWDL